MLGAALMFSMVPAVRAAAETAAQPGNAPSCSADNASANPDLELINKMGIEPRKIGNLGEFIAALPPGAMARLGELQKSAAEQRAKDWPNLCRYQQENDQVQASGLWPKVIFLGDSITENWKLGDPALFDATTINRGIGGQTTSQILLRFYQDVVALRPRVVHIMAGVNDILGNTGPTSDQAIVNNIRAMIDMAKANGIRVVLAAMTPSKTFMARPTEDLRPRIAAVNSRLMQLAAQQRVVFIDYTPMLADKEGAFAAALANDGLHPNRDGYALMRPLLTKTLARVAN
ncbi:GDSL-type esterase/lipase family protein [Novosphingobium sp. MMS21-SN21R]|uniref:GDSL-type esterase/lipase family protein n=1 Tax=Novosphingobium sp. MMS21-SN21R TaxID=2969298 RepID=UPI0028853D78|nr:GDSL-type esterase/lipase family protein [Novosphingobium sp. MMS21-SN21R]MDT0509754.1 GDSL-type esterase/lipase family protein [Novosphingobium sp. MMS21-SN21R]